MSDFETHPVGTAKRIALLEAENARLRNFVHFLATNPRKPATWMQTREAAADLLAALKGDE